MRRIVRGDVEHVKHFFICQVFLFYLSGIDNRLMCLYCQQPIQHRWKNYMARSTHIIDGRPSLLVIDFIKDDLVVPIPISNDSSCCLTVKRCTVLPSKPGNANFINNPNIRIFAERIEKQ